MSGEIGKSLSNIKIMFGIMITLQIGLFWVVLRIPGVVR
jgi:hypothetical protein